MQMMTVEEYDALVLAMQGGPLEALSDEDLVRRENVAECLRSDLREEIDRRGLSGKAKWTMGLVPPVRRSKWLPSGV
jgi:hypothetical protein